MASQLRFSRCDQLTLHSEEGAKAKDGLLLWCRRKTQRYETVDIVDFARSWGDGMAFAALIHAHRPDIVSWQTMQQVRGHRSTRLTAQLEPRERLDAVFRAVERHLGIPSMLDIDNVVSSRPDDRTICAYVALLCASLLKTSELTAQTSSLRALWSTRRRLVA